ncbi:MAG: PAS domain S-box protein, partial [Bacteroidetes bacterium]|nr:PAS domain S-box protein [Bacteroidota bacterium]
MAKESKKSRIENLELSNGNRNMFYSLFENALNAIFLGIPDGTLLEANQAALDMFGYSLEEIRTIGRAVIFDHDDENMIKALKYREKKGRVEGEFIGIRKNGERFPCEVSSAVFETESGELRSSTIIVDITERKKAEREMSLLINNTEESFILLDKDLCIVSFNKQFKDRYKKLLNKDVAKGDSILNYVQPNRLEIVKDTYKKVLSGQTVEDEIEVFTPDQGHLIFSSIYKPALDNSGNIIGAFVTTRDVTERKKVQQLVVSNEKRFRSIIEYTGDLITLTNGDGNIIYMSLSLEKAIGYTQEEILNKSYKMTIHPDFKEESELIFEQLIKNPGVPIPRLTKILHKDGHFVWVEGVVTNLLQDENVKAIVSNYRDISEKIEINQQKEYERKDKEALINSTDDLIWSVSKDFKLIAGNKAFINSMKVYTGAVLKRGDDLLLKDHFSDDFISFWKEMYQKALQGESFKKEVFSPVQGNTSRIWTETSFNPIYHEEEIIGIACYARDITERKLSGEKLRISKERYDIIAKATNDIIWDWNLVSNKIKWNKGILNVFGYTERESDMNIDWYFSKIHPKDLSRVKQNIELRISRKEVHWDEEYRFRCANGTYKYVNDRGFLVVNDSVPVRMIGAMQDITRQKDEEQHLKLLESVITHTNDAIMITEAEPFDEPGPRILYVNQAFTNMTGYTPEEVIGKSPRILHGSKTDKKELKRLSESIRKWQPCEVTVINYKKNGEEFWNNFSLSPIANDKGWFTHWISVERDVTSRKQDEIEREQIIAELSQNNLDLKQFSYVTSHNLRAPIANLLGLSSLIDYYDVTDESLKKILEGIKQSAKMFDETVKDLSKVLIIKDQINITLEEFSLMDMIHKSLSQLGISTDDDDVEISYHITVQKVVFTASFLESIFLNLFTNAIKYKSQLRKLQINISS